MAAYRAGYGQQSNLPGTTEQRKARYDANKARRKEMGVSTGSPKKMASPQKGLSITKDPSGYAAPRRKGETPKQPSAETIARRKEMAEMERRPRRPEYIDPRLRLRPGMSAEEARKILHPEAFPRYKLPGAGNTPMPRDMLPGGNVTTRPTLPGGNVTTRPTYLKSGGTAKKPGGAKRIMKMAKSPYQPPESQGRKRFSSRPPKGHK